MAPKAQLPAPFFGWEDKDMKMSDRFIKANDLICDYDNHIPAPYLRKSFTLGFEPDTAEITICGLGFYELYINGKNITKGPLAPYISNTDDICYYDNYSIKKYLNKGKNVIGIILGNGFRNPFGGDVWDFNLSAHRGAVTVALCLEAEDAENRFELEADESFLTHPSPIVFNDLRMGCIYDARLETDNWNSIDFDDSCWEHAKMEKSPRGEKRLCTAETIVVSDVIEAKAIEHFDKLAYAYETSHFDAPPIESTIKEDVYLYDFGVNTAGVTKLKINGTPGQKITVRHGEHKINGKFAINSTIFQRPRYYEYSQTDIYICKGGEEEFIPKFKYDGFRYAYVEGLKPSQATKDAVTALTMHSDIKERGGFSCSSNIINKLQKMTRQSDLSNFFYFPNDCPHREKNGWLADIWVSAEHMLMNLTVENSLREWVKNLAAAQRADGKVPCIVPTGGWGFEWGNGPAWDAACVQVPYYLYKYTGDISVIEENITLIMRYLVYISKKRNKRGLVAFGLGDWADPNVDKAGKILAPLEVTDSITVYDVARKAAQMFDIAQKTNERNYAQKIADELRCSIRERLIDFDTMTVSGNCQGSQVYAIECGIFDDYELDAARKTLVEIIHKDGDINSCGMLGMRYLFHALTKAGEGELAYKIITNTENSNCYGYWVKNGETTLCEYFKPLDSEEIGSRNHHFFGDISSWFIQELAGIKPNPQLNDASYFEFSPDFIGPLNYAQGYYNSKFGKITAKWERNENKISYKVSIPEGTHATVFLPDLSKRITGGEYEFFVAGQRGKL